MSGLSDLGLGAALTAVFWGYICAAFLDAFEMYTGTPWAFIISGLGFVWGYALEHLTKRTDSHQKNKLVLLGWLLPIAISGAAQTFLWLKPADLPWDITLSPQAPLYLLLWSLCSVHGINRGRSTDLATSQRNSLLGTLALAFLASLKLSDNVSLATGTLVFALISTLDIASVRQHEVLQAVQSRQRRYWTVGGAGFLALVLFVAAFASMGVPGAVAWIAHIASKLWSLVSAVIIYMAIPIAWIAEWAVMHLRRKLDLESPETQALPPFRRQMLEQLQEEGSLAQLPTWAHAVLVGATIIAALWLIWRCVLKRGTLKHQDSHLQETRTSLLEREAFRNWAKSSVDEILARMKANVTKALDAILPGKPKTVQELYFQSLEVVGKRVFPRRRNETPLEYLEHILEHVPSEEGRDALSYITELFCRCHYSNKQPQQSEWNKAVDAYSVLIQPETLRLQPPDTD